MFKPCIFVLKFLCFGDVVRQDFIFIAFFNMKVTWHTSSWTQRFSRTAGHSFCVIVTPNCVVVCAIYVVRHPNQQSYTELELQRKCRVIFKRRSYGFNRNSSPEESAFDNYAAHYFMFPCCCTWKAVFVIEFSCSVLVINVNRLYNIKCTVTTVCEVPVNWSLRNRC